METIPWMIVLSRILLGAGSQADARLPAPMLSSPLPHTVIIQGEVIPLKCSPPGGCRAESFFFSCKNQLGLPIESKFLSKNTFGLRTADLDSIPIKIMCTCRFWETAVEGSSSLQSNQLVFSVIDPLPPPVLKMDLLSGTMEKIKLQSISCLSSKGHNPKRFHFSQDGVEMTSSDEGPLRNSRHSSLLTLKMPLDIPDAKDHQSLGFACRYEENIKGRWVMSPWNQNFTVLPAKFISSMGYAALALLIPFLGVPLVFCWCRRKNEASGWQQRSKHKEKKEETRLNDLGSEIQERGDLQESHLTYVLVKTSSTVTTLGPRTKNPPKAGDGNQVMYSEIRVQATS